MAAAEMKLRLDRYSTGVEDTIGKFFIDDVQACYTLEDQPRQVKVMGDTRIPAGIYEVRLRTEGAKNTQFAAQFPKIHRGMLWLQGVPGFQFVLIHTGNTDKDTEGCILVGLLPDSKLPPTGRRAILQSKLAYQRIYPTIAGRILAGGRVTIEIRDLG